MLVDEMKLDINTLVTDRHKIKSNDATTISIYFPCVRCLAHGEKFTEKAGKMLESFS